MEESRSPRPSSLLWPAGSSARASMTPPRPADLDSSPPVDPASSAAAAETGQSGQSGQSGEIDRLLAGAHRALVAMEGAHSLLLAQLAAGAENEAKRFLVEAQREVAGFQATTAAILAADRSLDETWGSAHRYAH